MTAGPYDPHEPIKVGDKFQLQDDLVINPIVTIPKGYVAEVLEIWAIHDGSLYLPYFIVDVGGHKTGVLADMLVS